ncbi:MAG: HD domain-containing protein [Oscillospiraceae bacterium]|nr:HD domain-containing protein [Oscillospiraceae bacterium]
MQPRTLIDFMNSIEKLKCNTRHSYTSTRRPESVAEHCWRTAVMALLVADEFKEIDICKVVKMCLIHDLGEAITGDVPSFYKTDEHTKKEEAAIAHLLSQLPKSISSEFRELFLEMSLLVTPEAKLYKALDRMEAIIAHNEAPIDTWLPLEYSENLVYGDENVKHSEYLTLLKEEIKKDTRKKIESSL